MTTITTATEAGIETQVKAIFIEAGWPSAPFMSVKACETGGSAWRRGQPTGMFSIDVWGARSSRNSRSREHLFRTTKLGVVPVAKIREFAVSRLEAKVAEATAEKVRSEAVATNAATAEQLREYAKAKTGSYYSSYTSQYGGYITEDSGVSGKVKVNVGNLTLTEDQAKQLFDLIATFK